MAAQFQSTRWSLIRQAADPENSSLRERAWSEFDDLYRRPLFAFIRRWGWREPEAEDLLQGFLAKLANRDWLADADEERGKMRTFLLNRLKAHLLDARKHDAAQKRGGGVEQISVDDSSAAAEQLLAEEPDTRVFDREWAQALFDRVLAGLQSIAEAAGNGEVCRLLRAQLTEDSPERLREVAARLGRTARSGWRYSGCAINFGAGCGRKSPKRCCPASPRKASKRSWNISRACFGADAWN